MTSSKQWPENYRMKELFGWGVLLIEESSHAAAQV
jgi:hypothetical protein